MHEKQDTDREMIANHSGSENDNQRPNTDNALGGCDSLESTILKNFYLSFKFSQGNQELQKLLMFVLRNYYDGLQFTREFKSTSDLEAKLGPRVAKLRLPNPHRTKQIRGDKTYEIGDVSKEFDQQWQLQRFILGYIIGDSQFLFHPQESILGTLFHTPHQALMIRIANEIAERDIKFIRERRPERQSGNGDPHESFLKRYVLDHEPTGSREFDSLFSEVRIIAGKALSGNIEDIGSKYALEYQTLIGNMRGLKTDWKLTHREQSWD